MARYSCFVSPKCWGETPFAAPWSCRPDQAALVREKEVKYRPDSFGRVSAFLPFLSSEHSAFLSVQLLRCFTTETTWTLLPLAETETRDLHIGDFLPLPYSSKPALPRPTRTHPSCPELALTSTKHSSFASRTPWTTNETPFCFRRFRVAIHSSQAWRRPLTSSPTPTPIF
jgi:hypothetical protein